ncbi:hypothetical protein [uncultured Croceitalea sp.]|uniref:hypothetical protein n=1 Tax=uncultured Croceitalea sp. TaxID=1798908 RepID=UPI00374F98FB
MIKKFIKVVLIAIGVFLLAGLIYALSIHRSLPEGTSGPEADALANKMLEAINYKDYKATRFLEWSFRNNTHHYTWDKKKDIVEVRWSDNRVILNLAKPETNKVFNGDQELKDEKVNSLVGKAIEKFNNDSFWLVAPFKVFDKGTYRSIVLLDDGSKGLLVTYFEGGSTPGDSYLWKLNPNGFPNAFQMWVKIIPIGGIDASWDDWMLTDTGTYLPKSHKFGPITLGLTNVKGYN